jgi:hypothetical protein
MRSQPARHPTPAHRPPPQLAPQPRGAAAATLSDRTPTSPGWRIGTPSLPPGAAGIKLQQLREKDEETRTLLNSLSDQADFQRQVIARAKQRLAALAGQHTEWRNPTTEKVVPNPSIATAKADLDAAVAVLARLVERQTQLQGSRWRGMRALDDWVAAQSTFELAPPTVIPKGSSLAKVRARLEEIATERRTVESAPLPLADAVIAIRSQIAALAIPLEAEGVTRGIPIKIPTFTSRPQIHGNAGDSPIAGFASVENTHTFGVLCWIFEDAIVERLVEQLPPESPNALSDAERTERLVALDAEALNLMRVEEALLGPGDVRRASGIDARAILGLL